MMPYSVDPASNRALWIPATFVLGVLVVLAVNAILIVTAVTSFSGLETERAYEAGLQYNQTLAAAAINDRTGWRVEPQLTSSGGRERNLIVTLRDKGGTPVAAAAVSAKLVRPTNAGMDLTMSLSEIGDGRYRAVFIPPALGNWDLRIVARRGDFLWQDSQRMFIK